MATRNGVFAKFKGEFDTIIIRRTHCMRNDTGRDLECWICSGPIKGPHMQYHVGYEADAESSLDEIFAICNQHIEEAEISIANAVEELESSDKITFQLHDIVDVIAEAFS